MYWYFIDLVWSEIFICNLVYIYFCLSRARSESNEKRWSVRKVSPVDHAYDYRLVTCLKLAFLGSISTCETKMTDC